MPARRGGRPSKADAERLSERIVESATALFFTLGYGATSIEAVARRAGVSKRALYHRYQNKAALFSAVVHRTIERLRSPAGAPSLDGADLPATLRGLATLILRAALSPPALALYRLIVAESSRFPELTAAVAREGASEKAVGVIAGVLERGVRAGELAVDDPAFAARQFLQMVIAVPQRRALGLGKPMSAAEKAAWARDVVNLFLNGCRGWERE